MGFPPSEAILDEITNGFDSSPYAAELKFLLYELQSKMLYTGRGNSYGFWKHLNGRIKRALSDTGMTRTMDEAFLVSATSRRLSTRPSVGMTVARERIWNRRNGRRCSRSWFISREIHPIHWSSPPRRRDISPRGWTPFTSAWPGGATTLTGATTIWTPLSIPFLQLHKTRLQRHSLLSLPTRVSINNAILTFTKRAKKYEEVMQAQ